METSPHPFDEFLRQLAPLLQTPKFPSDPKSSPLFQIIEMVGVAAKHGDEWILVSGRAAITQGIYEPEEQQVGVDYLDDLVVFRASMPVEQLNDLLADLRSSWVLKREKVRLV